MKVKELMSQLRTLDPDADIRLGLHRHGRPLGTKPLHPLEPVIDQNTNRLAYYFSNVDIVFDYPLPEEKIYEP